MTEAEKKINVWLNQIIDEIHPLFKPISDEFLLEENSEYSRFVRSFEHKNGKRFKIKWKIYGAGNIETVKTIFEPAETI